MADSNKKVIGQFIKFALIGVVNTLVDLIVFKILNAAFHWVIPAQIIAYAAGIANSYVLLPQNAQHYRCVWLNAVFVLDAPA